MSGETERDISGWTVDTLKEYLEKCQHELEKRIDQRFEDMHTAVSKAETAHEKRFDSINEFRAQLRDQQVTFMPRPEAEKSIQANAEKIDSLQARMDRNEGRGNGLNQGWAYLVGAVGLAATVIIIVMTLSR